MQLQHLVRDLRQEFSARSNIRVTSIEPGVVATELTDTITDESLQGFIENAKKMETLQAGDIANANFVCS